MALVDPTETITTSLNDISYIAGQEPWNKSKDSFNIDAQGTDTNNYISNWNKWHGIYRKIPEVRTTIDLWCKWLIGKELICDSKTKKIINRIKGNGIDSFRNILINLKRVSKICGDSYAEIIRDKAGRLINLKIINSGSIKIEANNKGIIKKYIQVSSNVSNKTDSSFNVYSQGNLKILQEWKPEEIFHIANDRIADEIHGIPEIEKLFDIIKWQHQCMNITGVVFQRYIKPLLEIHANTDDPDELADLKTKYDNATKYMENVIIPKGSIEKTERISIPQYSTLDPLPWMKYLRSYFTESSNVPELIRGKSDEVSLAAGKLNYVGFKEKIIMEQLEFSEYIKLRLGLDIQFEAPIEIDIEIARQTGFDSSNGPAQTSQDKVLEKRIQAKENKVVTSGKTPNE